MSGKHFMYATAQFANNHFILLMSLSFNQSKSISYHRSSYERAGFEAGLPLLQSSKMAATKDTPIR